MIHVDIALSSSNHALHTSSSTSPIITRENSIDGLYITIQESCRVTSCTKSNCSSKYSYMFNQIQGSCCQNSFYWHL